MNGGNGVGGSGRWVVCLEGRRNTKKNLTVAGCSGQDSNPPPPDCITAGASWFR